MSDESLAEKVNTEAPWWAKAPIWLAAGIVGVPSLMAIGAGYFIAQSVNQRLNVLTQYNVSELQQMDRMSADQAARWDTIHGFMRTSLEIQIQNCVHQAKNQREQDECIAIGANLGRLVAPK